MGMHIGIVAARATVADLRTAFEEAWPDWEVVGTTDQFESVEAAWSWMEANEQLVTAADWTRDNAGKQTCILCQDREWAILIDPTYTLPTDEDALRRLSARLDVVLSFVVESAGGCAFFWCYTMGELRRSITYSDGEVKSQGDPLPEEAGIDVQRYYMDETEALMRAFGLSPMEQLLVPATAVGMLLVDRTDYSHVHQAPNTDHGTATPRARTASKPWWKFW